MGEEPQEYAAFAESPADGDGGFLADGGAAPQPPARPAMGSRQNLVLIPLCRKGERAQIERHLKSGAFVGETDFEGNTPLHVAVEAPRNEIATVQCLLEFGADPNAVNYLGAAPLHYVCLRKSNYRGIANILLENGAYIDCPTLAGKTPLHFACEQQLPELVETLCQFAASTNATDSEGNTPMHLVLKKEGGRDTVKRQVMESLIAAEAAFSCANLEGWLPVHFASRHGHLRCLQLLLASEADVGAATPRGETCLSLACAGGFTEVTQMLAGTNPTTLNQADAGGNTPLHVCAASGTLECAVVLLRSGANVELKNQRGQTPVDLAKVKGTDLSSNHNPELLQLLKDQSPGRCHQM